MGQQDLLGVCVRAVPSVGTRQEAEWPPVWWAVLTSVAGFMGPTLGSEKN